MFRDTLISPQGKSLKSFSLKTIAATSVFLIMIVTSGCSSSPIASTCPGLTANELREAKKEEALYLAGKKTGFAAAFYDPTALEFPNCFDSSYVRWLEETAGATANWDGKENYDYENSLAFLPQGRIINSEPSRLIKITDDPAKLSSAFNDFTPVEGDGENKDYEVGLAAIYSKVKYGQNSNRTRDRESYDLSLQFSAHVYMDGDVSIWVAVTFDKGRGDGADSVNEALCNGMLVEARGEAIKIPGVKACGTEEKYDIDVRSIDLLGVLEVDPESPYTENKDLLQALKVMASGPFSIFLVDTEGMSHEFMFSKQESKIVLKALTAVKAIQLGFGY